MDVKVKRMLATLIPWVLCGCIPFVGAWIGSIIINHTSLKPEGYTSRTLAYFFLGIVTLGIYPLVASLCNLSFDPMKERNIGYRED